MIPQESDIKQHRYRIQCWQVMSVIEGGQPVGEYGSYLTADVSLQHPICDPQIVQKIELDLTENLRKQTGVPGRVLVLGWTKYEDSLILSVNPVGSLLLPS
jgi:hypothetical protein